MNVRHTSARRAVRTEDAPPDPGAILTRATLRASELLGLKRADLADVIGVSASTVSRFDTRPLDPARKEGQLAVLFVRMFRSLDAVVGGASDQGRAWLHSDNQHLGGVPAVLIRTPEGLVNVVQYLDAARGKV